jgi:hypothetical protein
MTCHFEARAMRTCKTCGVEKSLMDFYRHTSGTLQRECKECWKAYVKANRLARAAQYAEYERGRANLPHRVEARKEYAATPHGRANGTRAKRAYLDRNPAKRAAHIKTRNAIRDGKLIRKPCEVCGEVRAQAHHDDYGKPLDVRWLCTTHHTEWHRHNTPKVPDQEQAA